ncbi:RadC family protein [Ferroacidibacillus organovorans]|nr:DNA repair protein RadC [Ferroacidibacillus organovorans]
MTERGAQERGTLMMDRPLTERPRERMMQYGAQSLSTSELLALLLGTGRRGVSALDLADDLLSRMGGLRELLEADVRELRQIPGVGRAKALAVLAAIELGRRVSALGGEAIAKIGSPKDAADYVMDKLRFLKKEHFFTIHLDTKHQIIGEETVSVGSLNASIVHPREIFKTPLRRSAAAIICAHNHPSGDPTPSPEDISVTQRLVRAGSILGIEVLDHIVIGDKRYISLRERGFMDAAIEME